MAVILELITIGEVHHLVVDADPSAGAGTPAAVGSMAQYSNGTDGFMYLKYGVNDTDWDLILRLQDGPVKFGLEGRLPIYFQDGYEVDDEYGAGNNLVFISADLPAGVRSNPLHITFPDLGVLVENADVVLTEGTQLINGLKTFGDDTTFNQDVLILGSLEVQGSLTYLNTTNTQIEDVLITLNKGGSLNSATNSGFELEEDSVITGYFKTTADRLGWQLKAPGQTGIASLLNPVGNFSYTFPERSGTFLLGDGVSPTGNYAQIGWFSNLNELDSEAGTGANALTWDFTNNFLGVQQSAPKSILHVGNNTTSGTVGTGSIILGVLHSTNNTGVGSLIANGSGGANTASGVDSTVFGAGNTSSGVNSLAIGNLTTASGLNAFSGGLSSIADANYTFAFGRRAKTGGFAGSYVISDSQDADITATKTNQFKARFQNGFKFNKGLDNTDPNFEMIQAGPVNTTDATITTLQTLNGFPSNCVALVEARVLGIRTGGTSGNAGDSATYIRTFRVTSIAGVVDIDDTQSTYTSEKQNGWNCTIDVDAGTDVRIRVKGANNNNVTWHTTTKIQILSF